MNPDFFSKSKKHNLNEIDEEEEKDSTPAEPKDLTKLFPEIKSLAESIIEKTAKHLKHDEVQIVERLIKKYGDNNHGKMAKDIKINYLQWSRGQIVKNIETYLEKVTKK
jgi:hypothetical protein